MAKKPPKPPGRVRDAKTGRYVEADKAITDPGGTVRERDKPKPKPKSPAKKKP